MPSRDKEKNRIAQRKWYKNHREIQIERSKQQQKKFDEWFKEYKAQFKCEKCGESESVCIDFHHNNPNENDVLINTLVSRRHSKKKIIEEIKKCTPLCANCHRKFHKNNGWK